MYLCIFRFTKNTIKWLFNIISDTICFIHVNARNYRIYSLSQIKDIKKYDNRTKFLSCGWRSFEVFEHILDRFVFWLSFHYIQLPKITIWLPSINVKVCTSLIHFWSSLMLECGIVRADLNPLIIGCWDPHLSFRA